MRWRICWQVSDRDPVAAVGVAAVAAAGQGRRPAEKQLLCESAAAPNSVSMKHGGRRFDAVCTLASPNRKDT